MATKEGIMCIPLEERDSSTAKSEGLHHRAHQEENPIIEWGGFND